MQITVNTKHRKYTGQIYRDGKHFRKVIFTLWAIAVSRLYICNEPLKRKYRPRYSNRELLDIVNYE